MKDLLEFIIKGIIPGQKFKIKEETPEGGSNLSLEVEPESVGLIIGKGGRVIKAIRNILRVRATLEKKTFFLEIKN